MVTDIFGNSVMNPATFYSTLKRTAKPNIAYEFYF